MPDTGWFATTGHGERLLNGGAYVEPLYYIGYLFSTTNPNVRILDADSTKRVMYAGSVGFGGQDNNDQMETITEYSMAHNLQYDQVFVPTPTIKFGGVFCDRFWWKMPPGTEWRFLVAWA